MKLLSKLFLAILPLLLILEGVLLYQMNGHFYLRNADPEYHYLLNSLQLANGHINLNTDHPGTPLQVFMALINRIVFLFRDEQSLSLDVITHPELYLKIDLFAALLTVAGLLYLTGLIGLRFVKQLPLALFFQFGPFLSVSLLCMTERIMPETVFLGIVPLFFAVLLHHEHTIHSSNNKPFSYWLLILAAVCTSLKFNFLPFAILPILLQPSWRTKFRTLAVFILAFVLISFPLFVRMGAFSSWISGILMHSGRHGSGEATIFDTGVMMSNFADIWQRAPWLYVVPACSLIIIAINKLTGFAKTDIERRKIRLLSLITAMLLFQLVLIAKHYAPHYLVPAQLCIPFMIYLSLEMIPWNKQMFQKVLLAVLSLIGLLFIFNDDGLHILPEQHQWRREAAAEKNAFISDLSNLNQQHCIILSSDDWTVRPEYALWFGKIMTPDNGRFNQAFIHKYPMVYFHKEGTGLFFDWQGNTLTASELAEQSHTARVISRRYSNENVSELMNALLQPPSARLDSVLENPKLHLCVWNWEIP